MSLVTYFFSKTSHYVDFNPKLFPTERSLTIYKQMCSIMGIFQSFRGSEFRTVQFDLFHTRKDFQKKTTPMKCPSEMDF